jgi:hypothetical protein
MPLMVALGAAEEEPAALVYHQPDFMGNWTLSSFRFGDPARTAAQVNTVQSLGQLG